MRKVRDEEEKRDQAQGRLNAQNLFNVSGFTEAEEGSIPANGIVRARSHSSSGVHPSSASSRGSARPL